jgi:hypothetical protein
MAGLLIKELQIHSDVERGLVVAPGGLVEQWQDDLSCRFGLSFEILTRQAVEAAETGNSFAERPRWLVRLDPLARNDDLQAKLNAAEWDVVAVDEAHKMSPASDAHRGRRAGRAPRAAGALAWRASGRRASVETEAVERASVDAVLAAERHLGRHPTEMPRNTTSTTSSRRAPTARFSSSRSRAITPTGAGVTRPLLNRSRTPALHPASC